MDIRSPQEVETGRPVGVEPNAKAAIAFLSVIGAVYWKPWLIVPIAIVAAGAWAMHRYLPDGLRAD